MCEFAALQVECGRPKPVLAPVQAHQFRSHNLQTFTH